MQQPKGWLSFPRAAVSLWDMTVAVSPSVTLAAVSRDLEVGEAGSAARLHAHPPG